MTALQDVTFTIAKGQVVVLLGPSGCGKTTTLRLTNRLETLTRGRITVNGRDIGEGARRSCTGAWFISPEQVKKDYGE